MDKKKRLFLQELATTCRYNHMFKQYKQGLITYDIICLEREIHMDRLCLIKLYGGY